MLATYPGMSEDPVRDSKLIHREQLAPILERLKLVVDDLERYVETTPADYDDDGYHGD
jgi:hypothetical protein